MNRDELEELTKDLSNLAATAAEGVNFCELVKLARLDPAIDFVGADLTNTDLAGLDLRAFDFRDADFRGANTTNAVFDRAKIAGAKFGDNVSSALRRSESFIRARPRQEERVAMLIREVLDSGRTDILHGYWGDDNVLAMLRLLDITDIKPDNIWNAEQEFAQIVPTLFRDAIPQNRGRLLYYLAKHLAGYPQINRAIHTKVDSTRSVHVAEVRSKIKEMLYSAS